MTKLNYHNTNDHSFTCKWCKKKAYTWKINLKNNSENTLKLIFENVSWYIIDKTVKKDYIKYTFVFKLLLEMSYMSQMCYNDTFL